MIRSKPFRISRTELILVCSAQYLRRMWPIFAAFPVFGILAIILGPNQLIRAIGFFALLWPFSIPARVAMATGGIAKRLRRPMHVKTDDSAIYFIPEEGAGMKIERVQLRRVDLVKGFLVFETRNFNFALAPVSAFDDADVAALTTEFAGNDLARSGVL